MIRPDIWLIHTLGVIPLSGLYRISDLVCFLLRNVLPYRKGIIRDNLRQCFPTLVKSDLLELESQFYRHLCDLVAETIFLQRMGAEEILKRVRFENPEVMTNAGRDGRNILIAMGHSGNWEWAGAATQLRFGFTLTPVYRTIRDKAYNEFFIKLRARFGAMPVCDRDYGQTELPNPHALVLLADQMPGSRRGRWFNFMGRKTLFYRGMEVLSHRHNYAVVYAHVFCEQRGHYRIHLEAASADVSEGFVKFLQRQIEIQPYNWLWSHKRWKMVPASVKVSPGSD